MSEVRKIQISQDMVNDYARISGDDNPIHQDPSFARDEGFEEIADWFETLAKAERSHANRFQQALDNLDG